MKNRLKLTMSLALLGLIGFIYAPIGHAAAEGKTLLAIFAHPDDEISAAPLLARYAREGVKVKLAIVTDGQKGGSPGGEELKAIRAGEALCSTRALGIDDPILMEFVDGEVAENINEVNAAIAALFAEIRPNVVVTWGPEGGYGHEDHRLVSAVVAGLFQAGVEGAPRAVYFPGIPQHQIDSWTATSGFGTAIQLIWGATDEKYLQFKVPVSFDDIFVTNTAAACHVSQWSEEALVDINAFIEAGEQTVYLRKSHKRATTRTSLFND